MAAIAYHILEHTIIAKEGRKSLLAQAIGKDCKGKISPLFYLAAIPLAFVNPWIAGGLYVFAALLWLIPDPRIEQKLEKRKSKTKGGNRVSIIKHKRSNNGSARKFNRVWRAWNRAALDFERQGRRGNGLSHQLPLWFTLSHGIVNEIYYPHVDQPNTRDFQFLISDGETFCHEEKRDLIHAIDYPERDCFFTVSRIRSRTVAIAL